MARKVKKARPFSEDDPVCWQCFEDEALQDHIRSDGSTATCCICGLDQETITILDLGALMYPILQEQFVSGPYDHVFDGEDDDSGHSQQQGQSLYELIEEVLGHSVPFQNALERAIQKQDPADIADGGEPYFSDATLFVERPPYLGEHYERWRSAQEELRHHRRFFSEQVTGLFDSIFQDVEQRQGRLTPEGNVQSVVVSLPEGSVLFRARAADSSELLNIICAKPEQELGPPPRSAARIGRMNAEGVPVFYGAFDKQTCVAELRPPLHGKVAVGSFRATRELRLLDFRLLESGYWGLTELSYFQKDFGTEVERREFTRRLHTLIRAPVLPGCEAEYLITQAMAEYLAHVRNPGFDGLIFGSAQHEEGANVVLFPANFSEHGRATERLLTFMADSLTVNKVARVEYSSEELLLLEDKEGRIVVFDSEDND